MTFAYFSINLILINLLLIHLLLATILKSFYQNREEEVGKESQKKATTKRQFIYQKIGFFTERQEELQSLNSIRSASVVSVENAGRGNPEASPVPRSQFDPAKNTALLESNSKKNKKEEVDSSYVEGDSKMGLVAERIQKDETADEKLNGRFRRQNEATKGISSEEAESLSDKRSEYLAMQQAYFQKMVREWKKKSLATVSKINTEQSEDDDFDFKAFDKCLILLNINTCFKRSLFYLVYSWPMVLLEHLLILANSCLLLILDFNTSKKLLGVIILMNVVMMGHLIMSNLFRLVLIKSAGKGIKNEYFLILDIIIGLAAAAELFLGYVVEGVFMPASVLILMLMRFFLKIYCISVSTSLKELLMHMGRTMIEIVYFVIILLVIIFFFIFLGITLFGNESEDNSPLQNNRFMRQANFDSVARSFYTIFTLLTLENWSQLYMEYRKRYNDTLSTAFFLSIVFVVSIVMFKFLLSLIINNFVETSEKMEKISKYKQASSMHEVTTDDQIYSNLLSRQRCTTTATRSRSSAARRSRG